MSQKRSSTEQQDQKPQTSSSPVITQQPQSDSQKHPSRCEKGTECDESNSAEKGTGFIFHRNRELPTPNPNDPPIKRIKFYLDKYKIKEALQIFFDDETLKMLSQEHDFMWDIIPLICQRLRGLCQYRFRVFEGCERMLCRIADDEACNPKEVLIGLLAEINQPDSKDDDNVFRAMIRPLEGILMRMNLPAPREENFRCTLNVLMRHINEIELPQEYDLEGKKRQALPNDPSVKRFMEVLPLIISFIEEFNAKTLYDEQSPMPVLTERQIDEVLNGELADDDFMNDYDHSPRCDIIDASTTALIHLIYRPLTFLDTTPYCKEFGLCAHRCLGMLLKLIPNFFAPIYKRVIVGSASKDYFTEFVSSNHFEGNDDDAELALATCAYLYRCDFDLSYPIQLLSARLQNFPQILTHESQLFCHTPYIVALLKRSEILTHEKGLCLLEALSMPIACDSLDQKFVDSYKSSKLFHQLFQLMVYSPYCENRRRAYIIFTRICDLLTYDCKLDVFKWVLCQSDLKPCIRAACIDQYRKHLTIIYRCLLDCHQQLSKAASNSVKTTEILHEINLWQLRYKIIGGREMVDFLNLCIDACLPDTQHTDIIENYDLVLATLTIFRYLKLRKPIIKNEYEDEFLCGEKLKKVIFDPIRKAISMILTEIKVHHKELVDGHKKATQSAQLGPSSELLASLLDRQLELERPTGADKVPMKSDEAGGVECLNWILCRLDLVESVLVKTCDLYNC